MPRLKAERSLAAASDDVPGHVRDGGTRDSAGLTARQRAFVMLVVEGKSQADAYREAFGKPATYPDNAARTRGNAVASKPHVRAELDKLKAEITARVRVAAAAKHAISVQYVMSALHEVAERCMQHRPVLDGRGKPVMVNVTSPSGEVEVRALYTFDAKGAVGALLPLGKQLGMFVDRKEIRTGPLPDKTDAEIDESITQLLGDLAAATGQDVATLLNGAGIASPPPPATTTTTPTPTPQGGARALTGPPDSQ